MDTVGIRIRKRVEAAFAVDSYLDSSLYYISWMLVDMSLGDVCRVQGFHLIERYIDDRAMRVRDSVNDDIEWRRG